MNNSESFQENGYLLLDNAVPSELITEAESVTRELIKIENNYNLFPKYYLNDRKDTGVLYDIYFRHKIYRDLIEYNSLVENFEKIFGDHFYLYESSLVYKPPGKRNEVPFHQDFMNRASEPFKIIVWVALSDVNVENGALKIVKGSHKQGFRKYVEVKNEAHHTRLDGWEKFDSQSSHVEMKKGDALLFHNQVIHGSDRSTSTSDRLAARYAVQNFQGRNVPRNTPVILSRNPNYSNLPDSENDDYKPDNFKAKVLRKIRNYSIDRFPV